VVAHVSGNAAWVDYPNPATTITAARLENIENTRDALYTSEYGGLTRTKRATFRAYYAGSAGIPATTDVFVQTGWTADIDTAAAWTSTTPASYYTIPYGGRLWDISHITPTDSNISAGALVNGITLNAANPFSSIARQLIKGRTNDNVCHTKRIAVPLAAGDKLYFTIYSTVACTLAFYVNVVPEITVRDAGPA
jgi:hypothetical protein